MPLLSEAAYQSLLLLSPNILNFEKVITLKEQYLYGSKRLGVRRPQLELARAEQAAAREMAAFSLTAEPQRVLWRSNGSNLRQPHLAIHKLPLSVQAKAASAAEATEPLGLHCCRSLAVPTMLSASKEARRVRAGWMVESYRFSTNTPQSSIANPNHQSSIAYPNHQSSIAHPNHQSLIAHPNHKSPIAHPNHKSSSTYAYFKADVTTAQDYYPFGSLMPGRTYVAPANAAYRYGFNGMQRDDELKGPGNALDFGARMYDTRLGRWMSVDPLALEYVDLSPYNFVANNPIYYIDIDGKRIIVPDKAHQKVVSGYLKDQFGSDIFKYDKSGQLRLDKKAYKAAKGNFNQAQTDIASGVLEVIKSDRVIEVVLSNGSDINFSRNPLEPVEVTDPLTGETKVELKPKYFGRGYVIPELNTEAKTIQIPGDTKAFILMNIEASNAGVFDAESALLSGKEAGETGVWSIPQKTNPSASSIFVHELLDHGLDYVRTGSLNEPVGATPLDNVNFHNKALSNKGSKPRTGNDHD